MITIFKNTLKFYKMILWFINFKDVNMCWWKIDTREVRTSSDFPFKVILTEELFEFVATKLIYNIPVFSDLK